MIVIDASVVIEVLLRTPAGRSVEDRLFAAGESLHAPHLIDVEVVQVLRRLAAVRGGVGGRWDERLSAMARFPVTRYRHDLSLARIWELRHNLSAYDAIVLPNHPGQEILLGNAPGTMPDEYVGGVGAEGAAQLKRFSVTALPGIRF